MKLVLKLSRGPFLILKFERFFPTELPDESRAQKHRKKTKTVLDPNICTTNRLIRNISI